MRTKALRRPSAARRVKRKPASALAKRILISLDPKLAKKILKAARQRMGGNVSAWFAGAAEARLRHESGIELLRWMEEKNGPSTPEDIAKVKAEWA